MNKGIDQERIGQCYLRWDNGEIGQVTGRDEGSRTIEIQSFAGEIDEIEEECWAMLPLGLAQPPEGWTEPVDASRALRDALSLRLRAQ
jgi:hypothetical protein